MNILEEIKNRRCAKCGKSGYEIQIPLEIGLCVECLDKRMRKTGLGVLILCVAIIAYFVLFVKC